MKEININIEGYNVNGICVGCLNYNRRMFYHNEVKECFRLLGNIDVPDGLEVQVCWECLAHVRSAIRFKERILKSYDFLIQYSKEHTFLDSPNDFSPHASTSLAKTEVCIEECVLDTVLVDNDEKNVEVKEEETEEKYAFEMAIKEESYDDTYFQDVPALDNDITSDEDVNLSKLKEKETEKMRKKRKNDKKDRMPANKRPRKTSRGLFDMSQFEAAYDAITKGMSVREAAKIFGLSHVTLQRYKKKRKTSNFPIKMGYATNGIFTSDQEKLLTKYLKKYSEIFFGLSVRVVRQFAAELSWKLDLKRPKSWMENGLAGSDWYKNFVYRNKEVDVKIGKLPSKEKVRIFYDKLWNFLSQYNFGPENIYCLDEIGVNIEEDKDKIWLMSTRDGPLALKGSQIKLTYAANAVGYAMPPLFLIPRNKDEETKIDVKIKTENVSDYSNETTFNNFLKNGVDLKNLPDWTEDSDLLVFLKHFMKHLDNSLGPKLVLMLENQTYHLSISCMEFCTESDITLLVIPTYLAQNIQPLHSVISPLKKSIISIFNAWVKKHTDQKISIYNMPNIVSEGFLKSLDQSCIKDGFNNTGIYPYNREIIINGLEANVFDERLREPAGEWDEA